MADENVEDESLPKSHPFFIRGGFPFVFLPTTFTTGFSGANNQTRVSTSDNQTKVESRKKKASEDKSEDNNEEIETEEEEEGGGGAKTNDDDETKLNKQTSNRSNQIGDLRISQPKYSQLLRDLDFSKARMVDVTNLLTDEVDPQANYLSPDENESPEKVLDKKQYECSPSEESDNESSESTSNNKNNNGANDNQTKENDSLINAANEIQNDLDDLAAILQAAASQMSIDQDENEDNNNNNNNNLQKKHTFDEDDDTSKQATQNYDLNDFEQEETMPSPNCNKVFRLISQETADDIHDNSQPLIPTLDMNINMNAENQNQTEEQVKEQQPIINWDTLVNGIESKTQLPSELVFSQPIYEAETTQKKIQEQKPSDVPRVDARPQLNSFTHQKAAHQAYQATSSSSSSDTDSVVQYALHRSNQIRSSPPLPEDPTPMVFRPQTLREDSQATLTDENLDELSIQIKQVLADHEQRQTYNINSREERRIDNAGVGSSSSPEKFSTNKVTSNRLDRDDDNLAQRSSNHHAQYIPEHTRYSVDAPERSIPQKTRTNQHRRYTTSRITEHNGDPNERKDNWLSMLERLEHEHRIRLEKQQQEYEEYVQTLEEKMKRRFDDYLTLTNGAQESRLDDYNDNIHTYHTPSSVPIDSNIGRPKNHSRSQHYRTLAKDLIAHYYPADSTLNILTSDNKRTMDPNHIPQSKSREDNLNFRTDIFAKHAKHIADLKLYYEYEINELKSQLNRAKMGNTSSNTRQSMEIIERINNENIRLNDEIHDLRHSLKKAEEENVAMKNQLEEFREELNKKDNEIKTYHQTIVSLEEKLTEAENKTERHDEKLRYADRQTLFYREENEKIKTDLNLTRERLIRLEERHHEQENENEILRRQLFMLENETTRAKSRMSEEPKLSSTMVLNEPTSKEYGRFTLSTTRNASPIASVSRDAKIDSRRVQMNDIENSLRHAHSPRPMTRISDYLNERPTFPTPYVPPTRHTYTPRKASPSRRRTDPTPTRVHTSVDRQARQSEQLEQKFDQLLRKKRELEARLNRIPLRGLTKTDRQLYEVLEREIERVEQQISSVKLELRKLTILRTH